MFKQIEENAQNGQPDAQKNETSKRTPNTILNHEEIDELTILHQQLRELVIPTLNQGDIRNLPLEDLQGVLSKGSGLMIHMQTLAKTPIHQFEVGQIENFFTKPDPKILETCQAKNWYELADTSYLDDDKVEEALKYLN